MKKIIEHPLTLEGNIVKLIPLEPEHIPTLLEFSLGAHERYQYTSTPTDESQVEAYFKKAFTTRANNTSYPFAIFHKSSSEIVGSTRYSDIDWQNRNLELGYTWLAPKVEGTAVNIESKYLLLKYVFETLNFYRVQIITDARNKRSQAAIKRLGSVFEGTLRRHKIQKNGYLRDTMVFSITDLDWQESVKATINARLEKKLAQNSS